MEKHFLDIVWEFMCQMYMGDPFEEEEDSI